MHSQLRKVYFRFIIPAIIGFCIVAVWRYSHKVTSLQVSHMGLIAPAIFILAAVCAIAGPILYRSFFAYRQRHQHRVSSSDIYKFERNQTAIALTAPYLALAGFFMELPRFHMAGLFLMALYAVYYYYPHEKRILAEEKIYRINHRFVE